MKPIFNDKRGIEWDALIIWVLVAIAAVIILLFIATSRGWLQNSITEIGDIFRFGG